MAEEQKGPILIYPILEIHIVANIPWILEALRNDNRVALTARCQSNIVVFTDRLTVEERRKIKPNQRFIFIHALDEYSIPAQDYQAFIDETSAIGAKAEFLPIIRDSTITIEQITDFTVLKLGEFYGESDAKAKNEAQLRFENQQHAA